MTVQPCYEVQYDMRIYCIISGALSRKWFLGRRRSLPADTRSCGIQSPTTRICLCMIYAVIRALKVACNVRMSARLMRRSGNACSGAITDFALASYRFLLSLAFCSSACQDRVARGSGLWSRSFVETSNSPTIDAPNKVRWVRLH
jgi:hypothetical protein